MAASYFSYNLTRPYPFRWFTLTVVLGGLVAFTLFTVLNLITSGYYMSTEFSQNPNATMADGPWFQSWPSYFSGRMLPSCEPVTLPVGSQVFTNHSGLTYTLVSVVEPSDAPNGTLLSPSLSYLNHPLQSCSISLIQIDVESADRAAWQFAAQQWGSTSRAFISCTTLGPAGATSVYLTVEYNLLPANVYRNTGFNAMYFPTFQFLRTDAKNSAALYWGQSLLSMYWNQLSHEMQVIRDHDFATHNDTRKGTIEFTTGSTKHDITHLEFFDAAYRFIYDNTSIILANPKDDFNLSYWDATQRYPNVWLPADALGKSLYSAVLADLGQTTESILTNPDSLQFYTKDFTALNVSNHANTDAGPALDSYDNLKDTTGPLTFTPAVFSQKYLCQVPRRKAVGSLIMAILLANLVLLSASWTILRFLASAWVQRADPTANYCAGCAAHLPAPTMSVLAHASQRDVPALDLKPSDRIEVTTTGYTPVTLDDGTKDRPWSLDSLAGGVRRKPVPAN